MSVSDLASSLERMPTDRSVARTELVTSKLLDVKSNAFAGCSPSSCDNTSLKSSASVGVVIEILSSLRSLDSLITKYGR